MFVSANCYPLFSSPHLRYRLPQIAIRAGHEFIISTDPKYSEICDDKVLWVDYVGCVSSARHYVAEFSCNSKTFPRLLRRGN